MSEKRNKEKRNEIDMESPVVTISPGDIEILKEHWAAIDAAKADIKANQQKKQMKQLEGDKWAFYLQKLTAEKKLIDHEIGQQTAVLEKKKLDCRTFYSSLSKKYGVKLGEGAINPDTGIYTPAEAIKKRENGK